MEDNLYNLCNKVNFNLKFKQSSKMIPKKKALDLFHIFFIDVLYRQYMRNLPLTFKWSVRLIFYE